PRLLAEITALGLASFKETSPCWYVFARSPTASQVVSAVTPSAVSARSSVDAAPAFPISRRSRRANQAGGSTISQGEAVASASPPNRSLARGAAAPAAMAVAGTTTCTVVIELSNRSRPNQRRQRL